MSAPVTIHLEPERPGTREPHAKRQTKVILWIPEAETAHHRYIVGCRCGWAPDELHSPDGASLAYRHHKVMS